MITQEQLIEEMKATFEKLVKIAEKKNHDYAGSDDNAFFNFELGELMRIGTTEQGFLFRITDKFSRIINFINTGTLKVEDEKIDDTLGDFINYITLLKVYIKYKKSNAQEEFIGDGCSGE